MTHAPMLPCAACSPGYGLGVGRAATGRQALVLAQHPRLPETAKPVTGECRRPEQRSPQIGTEHFRRSAVLLRRERANAFKKPAFRTRNEDHEVSGAGTTGAGH